MEQESPDRRESLWRRKLSRPERAELRGQPELELEARLTETLTHLPNTAVPSNFTARVLAAIELEEAQSARSKGWRWNWHWLLPRLAVATAVLLFAGLGIQQHELARNRAELARSLSLVADASTVPSVEALENLEVIQRMSQPVQADTELLAALQ